MYSHLLLSITDPMLPCLPPSLFSTVFLFLCLPLTLHTSCFVHYTTLVHCYSWFLAFDIEMFQKRHIILLLKIITIKSFQIPCIPKSRLWDRNSNGGTDYWPLNYLKSRRALKGLSSDLLSKREITYVINLTLCLRAVCEIQTYLYLFWWVRPCAALN